MPGVALPDTLQQCKIFGCLYTPYIFLRLRRWPFGPLLKTSSCFVPFKILLGILGYWISSIWGLFEVGRPTKPLRGRPYQTLCSYARRSGCLYTLFDQYHDSVFFSFFSIKPAMRHASMLGDYYTWASSMPSCFLRCTNLLGNLFLITSFLDLLLLLFLYHQTSHPIRHDARIVLYEYVLDTLWIFSSSFRSIGSLLPIGHHSTSLHSARLQIGWLLSLLVFLLDRRARYSTSWWLQDFVMTLSRSLRLHITWGFVRHGYPWVPMDQAHGRLRQVGPAHRKTRRPVSRPVWPDMWAWRQENNLGCKSRQSRRIKAAQISLPCCELTRDRFPCCNGLRLRSTDLVRRPI
jgi:hypothetical protein